MKLSYFSAVIAFAVGSISAQGQSTNAPINTIPEGITTFQVLGTALGQTSISYFSAPLSNDPVYTGAVSSITTVTAAAPDTINVGDSPAPWQGVTLPSAATPYFVKFLSGAEVGRVMMVTSNSASGLTLDTTDGTLSPTKAVALNTANFAVAPGDTFEVFAGDTLGLMFGTSTANLVLIGGAKGSADTVSVYDRSSGAFDQFYFNSALGFWVPQSGTGGVATNSNNVVIYPYSAFFVTRHSNHPGNTSFVLTGRVAEVSHLVQTNGRTSVYDSTGYPVDVKLSQLNLGASWKLAPTTAPIASNADTIAVYDVSAGKFDTYFELNDTNTPHAWRLAGDLTGADQSGFTIPAGTTVSFLKRAAVSGSASYLIPALPYSLTN